jgi:hydroxymethylpyrimidine/phosphomethylpyrimidine kinase
MNRPYILTIAGFDPTGCAGLLADCKTIEANGGYGMAVCTANTFQNDTEFDAVNWMPEEQIINQYRVLKRKFSFNVVKIGLIPNFQILENVVNMLHEDNPEVKIIWDPVFKASAGYEFHLDIKLSDLENILKKIFLLTPNLDEAQALIPDFDPAEIGKQLASFCHTLIKGGHIPGNTAMDRLYMGKGSFRLETQRIAGEGKRGSGCVLSSAIATQVALGVPLPDACRKAKAYITHFISSDEGLIGYHF